MSGDDDGGGYSSPPCFLHELDPSWLGLIGRDELLELLGTLLEAERAGAKVAAAMAKEATAPATQAALKDVAGDEARFCAMLERHIRRLGGSPSRKTGAFREKVMALDGEAARLALLNRGQGWVVKRLREALLRLGDDALRRDLEEMLAVHETNIARCDGL